MKTAIITDTNSGLTVEDGKRIGVYVLPMPVIVDGRGYLEGVDITHSELYEALRFALYTDSASVAEMR